MLGAGAVVGLSARLRPCRYEPSELASLPASNPMHDLVYARNASNTGIGPLGTAL